MIIQARWIFKLITKVSGEPIIGFAIYPFIVVYDKMDKQLVNHEEIHIEQQKELYFIPFFIKYFWELAFKGYDDISFEREAYANDDDLNYLKRRPRYAFLDY